MTTQQKERVSSRGLTLTDGDMLTIYDDANQRILSIDFDESNDFIEIHAWQNGEYCITNLIIAPSALNPKRFKAPTD